MAVVAHPRPSPPEPPPRCWNTARGPRGSSAVRRLLTTLLLAATALGVASPAAARPRRPRVKYEDPRQPRPSATYAALGRVACLKELKARKVGFTRVEKAPGVLAPVRLTGPVGGVLFRSDASDSQRASSSAEVFDCRLVLALSDWSRVLVARGVDEVRFASAWRPPPRSWPAERPATRHPGALAIDVKRLGKKLDPGEKVKRWLVVEKDFHGKIGAPVCGARAASRSAARASAARSRPGTDELRALVCETGDRKLFTSILTPSYDRAHRDHLHLEITPVVTWSLLL